MALAAAALVAFVALTVNVARETVAPPAEEDQLRAAEGARPRAAAPVGPVATQPAELVWEGLPSADGYRLEILSAEGEPLWESDVVRATSLPWPDDLALEGGRYYWRVRALADDGAQPIVSELAAFDLAER